MDERWILYFGLFLLIIFYVEGFTCGDTILDDGEVCDGNNLNRQNCTNFNYTGGILECLNDCSGYNFGGCEGEEVCGNGIILGSELCEPSNIRGRTCENEGYEGGTLKCRNDCLRYDYSECTGNKSICGDEKVTGSEECDNNNLSNKSCENLDYDFGVLSCYTNCSFNFENCFNEDIKEIEEEGEINDTINESGVDIEGEVPSGVVGVAGSESKKGLSLINWLLISLGVFVVGVVIIYIYIFKIKK